MTGFCNIDGVDIYTQYGVIIAENGYSDFFTFPALMEPEKNDWAEENGIEVDLSSPIFQPREITVPFAVISGINWKGFYQMLSAPGYRNVNIQALQKNWLLRVSEMPAFEEFPQGITFEVKFVEDVPAISRTYPIPAGFAPLACALAMDGVALDKYGIVIEDGLNDLQKPATIKKNLTRKNSLTNGQIYDAQFVRFAEKEITLKCCLSAPQIADFWNLYNAFLGDLTKSGERIFTHEGQTYYGYYRKSGNFDLVSHSREVVLKFDVTLCITR